MNSIINGDRALLCQIHSSVDLFRFVETHINSDWYNVKERIKKGKMI